MAYIQKIKRKKGVAHQVLYYIDGVRNTQYFPATIPYHKVKKFANDVEYKHVEDIHNTILHDTSLEELVSIYQEKRASEVDTWRETLALNGLIKVLSPTVKIDNITHHVIHQYRDSILLDRLEKVDNDNYALVQKARRGVNKELYFLRVVFRWAYKNELVSAPIFDKVTMFKASKPKPDVLTREEDMAFYKELKVIGDRVLRVAYWILKYTGMRRSELIAIRYQDIDLKNGYIKLLKTKNMDEAVIPIHPRLARVLKWVSNGESDDILIPYKKDRITRNFRRAFNAAGLGHKKSPVHIFRHSLGARIIEHDLSDDGERLAQEILRHKTKLMTKYYTQIAKEKLKDKLSHVKV
jgi:integrase